MNRGSRLVVVLLVGACVLLAIHAFFYNATVDDAFITFRYSNNLLAGDGPRWNPGELPVEGYTSFVWMVIMAGAGLFRAHQALLANVAGVASGIAGLIVVWQLTRRLVADDRLALLAPLLLALDRTYAGWCTGGLETALFTTLILYGYSRWLREATAPGGRSEEFRPTGDHLGPDRRFAFAGVVFAVATLTRPEGAMYFGLAMLWSLVLWKQRRLSRRAFAYHVATYAVIVGAHLAFRLSYYGLPLPNTFYCKVNGLYWTSGLAYLLLFARHHAVLPLVFFAGLVGWVTALRNSRTRDAAVVALAFVAGLVAYVLYVGGDVYEFRFMDVTLPFVAIGAVVLVARLREPAGEGTRTVQLARRFGLPVAMILCTGATTPMLRLTRGEEDLEFTTTTPIAMHVERLEAQDLPQPEHVQIGQWLAAIKRPGDLLAIDSAGVIPYYSEISTLDLYGLNDAVIGRTAIDRRGWPGHEKRAPGPYIRQRAPSFFVPHLGDSIDAEACQDIKVRVGRICVRINEELFWTFGTFRPPEEFAAELRKRGADVVEVTPAPPRPPSPLVP